jgi:hypothetical protein
VKTLLGITPVELRGGIHWKREDFFRNAYGVNGSKFRACRHLLTQAQAAGYDHVVSAQATASPQSSICATLAEELGMRCTIVVGASKPHTAIKHPNIAIAMAAGAELDTGCRVAYNGTLQPYARALAERLGAYQLPYAISPPANSSLRDVEAFLQVNAPQVANLPDEIETLVLPFGSANTACGVIYGLHDQRPESLREIYLMEIGPSRREWARERLESVGRGMEPDGVTVKYITLHEVWASYSDQMPETMEGIVFHPWYEGKMIRFLNLVQPDWWTRRDGTTGFWIVGGPG